MFAFIIITKWNKNQNNQIFIFQEIKIQKLQKKPKKSL